ncbi:DUF4175 family protein [Tautonia plasticadhaerens]|uniref:Uncharacterized protein n=1 Tax=Tautonia plasticadhaerens TaxID=2527974 RepID=A0A518GYD7_9BACT|nr:DUF4175 family protein [Tautonia plasticadhaerens]QDV33611.1 hypothetical protein ElP_14870 [Tautonia plasticadhaerens]
MTGTLDRRIAGLRGRLRRLLALRGLCWVAFAAVMAFIAITWIDWFVPLAWDVRLAALVIAGVVLALVAWRELIRPLTVPFDDLRLALLIERRWPHLNERLSSTIAFLKARGAADGEDGRYGSEALRELTISQALTEVESLDFSRVVDPRPLRLAGLLAAWAVAMLVAESVAAPEFQSIAVRRFLLGEVAWPKRTELSIAEVPVKIARGMSYELTARAEVGRELPVVPPRAWFEVLSHVAPPLKLLEGSLQGRPPGSARVTYRFEDGETVNAPLRPDEDGAFHGRLDVVNRPFRFYVAAGDDSTDWIDVAVVPPPTLDEVQVRVVPPPYTRPFASEEEREAAVETLAPDQTQIRALEGSQVRFSARANKPLTSAELMNEDASTGLPVALLGDRSRLDATIEAAGAGSFWFTLKDLDGFTNPEATRYELRSIVDTPPLSLIVEPQFDVSVPASATVPIRIRAEDDYGLQLVRLLFTATAPESAESEDHVVPLWTAEASIDAGRSQEQEVEHRLELASMALQPGAMITAYAEARDFFSGPDDPGPHLSRSRPLRIRVISDEEFRTQLDDRRREIRDEIERIAEMQKLAMPPVREAITELDATGSVEPKTGDELREASVMQRQVGGRLDESGNGLSDRLQRFLDEMENANVDDPEVSDQMRQMKAVVDRLRAEHIRPAEQGISRALRGLDPREQQQPPRQDQGEPAREEHAEAANAEAQPDTPSPAGETGEGTAPGQSQPQPEGQPSTDRPIDPEQAEARQSLDESRESQQAIARELDAMLQGLSEFETLRGVTREAERLLNDQDAITKETEQRATDPELMGKRPEDLDAEQQADLQNLSDRQRDVSDELQDLTARMDELNEGLAETDPLAAEALEDALENIRNQGASGKLGQAAERVSENQMGPAGQAQDEGREAIQDLVDTLKNRRENDLERLVKQLKETRDELAQAQLKQAELLKKTMQAQQGGQQGQQGQQGGQQGQQGQQGGQQGQQGGQQGQQGDQERLQQLAKEQEQLEQELRRQLQKLRKLRADQAARAGSRAAGRMANAGQELDEGDGEEARQNEEDALKDLEQAIAETDQAIQEAQDRLLMEQFAKIRDQLRAYNDRQKRLIEETVAFDRRREAGGGRLSRADSFDVRNLGRAQSGLKEETESLTERLDGAPVFKLSLERAAARMVEAAEGLAGVETGRDTQRAEEAASQWLERLVASLDPPDEDEEQGDQQQQQGGQQGQPGQQGNPGDGIPAEAQIRMLKAMQEDINIRTQELDELKDADGPLSEAQEREFVRLEEDQHTIADLLRDLIQPKRPDGLEE